MRVEAGLYINVIGEEEELVGRANKKFINKLVLKKKVVFNKEEYDKVLKMMVMETLDVLLKNFGEPNDYLEALAKDIEKRKAVEKSTEGEAVPKEDKMLKGIKTGLIMAASYLGDRQEKYTVQLTGSELDEIKKTQLKTQVSECEAARDWFYKLIDGPSGKLKEDMKEGEVK